MRLLEILGPSGVRGVCRSIFPIALGVSVYFAAIPASAAETLPYIQLRELLELAETTSVPDVDLAKRLRKLKLSTGVPEADRKAWAGRTYGPLSMEQLRRLYQEAKSKKPDDAPRGPASLRIAAENSQNPVPQERAEAMLERVRNYAIGYTASIPNFTCVRNTRVTSSKSGVGEWRMETTTKERLSMEKGRDRSTRLTSTRNRRMSRRPTNTISVSGEFGTLLGKVFHPETVAEFAWKGILSDGRWVLEYRVSQARSSLRIRSQGRSVLAAYGGFLAVDSETGTISEMTYRDEALPEGFPIRGAEGTICYGPVEIDGTSYLLPVEASMLVYVRGTFLHNKAVYEDYQKFDASSEISFDVSDETVKEGLTETPQKP